LISKLPLARQLFVSEISSKSSVSSAQAIR